MTLFEALQGTADASHLGLQRAIEGVSVRHRRVYGDLPVSFDLQGAMGPGCPHEAAAVADCAARVAVRPVHRAADNAGLCDDSVVCVSADSGKRASRFESTEHPVPKRSNVAHSTEHMAKLVRWRVL